jgi:hypothetical protein
MERDFAGDVRAIQDSVQHLADDVKGAAGDSADALKQRVQSAQADIDRDVSTSMAQARQAADQGVMKVQGSWAQMKADAKARIDQRNRELNATATEISAEMAEEDASEAIGFARWAVDNARVALLQAFKARVEADKRAVAAKT